MSLGRPSAVVSIAGQQLSSAEGAILWLRATLSVDGAHDAVELRLWTPSKFSAATPGDALSLALGDVGSEEALFTGTVTAVHQGPDGCSCRALAATWPLSDTWVSKSYVGQTVGDIVRDLAGAVAIDSVDAALPLAAWHVDNARPVWSHLQTLARLSGCDLAAAADGGLRFVPVDGGLFPKRLRHGAELLDWDLSRSTAATPPAVVAHGAGSEAGSSRAHWLRHGVAGSASRSVGGLATADAAEQAGKALAERASRAAIRGRLLIVGDAAIRAGDAIELADLPGGDPGALRVTAVEHTLDSRSGFLTRLNVEGAGGGGAGLGGLGL